MAIFAIIIAIYAIINEILNFKIESAPKEALEPPSIAQLSVSCIGWQRKGGGREKKRAVASSPLLRRAAPHLSSYLSNILSQ